MSNKLQGQNLNPGFKFLTALLSVLSGSWSLKEELGNVWIWILTSQKRNFSMEPRPSSRDCKYEDDTHW